MRLVLAVTLAIAAFLPGPAVGSADVLVPDDPGAPLAGGEIPCAAGAGDLVAYSRELQSRHGVEAPRLLEVRQGRQKPVHLSRVYDCPSVAAAADGTAVIGFQLAAPRTGGTRVIVRRPGQPLSAPIAPAEPAPNGSQPQVAAAPGGWVAAAWRQSTRVDGRYQEQIAAAVLAPDGAMRSALLDRDELGEAGRYVGLSTPRVAIDAHGVATVAWTRWTSNDEDTTPQIVRAARTTIGAAAWLPAQDIGTGADGPTAEASLETPLVGLAAAPQGRVILAWAAAQDVQSAEGDEGTIGPATSLALIPRAGTPTVSLTDDGAAVVAFSQAEFFAGQAQVLTTDRSSGETAWAAVHRLSGDLQGHFREPAEGEPLRVSDDNPEVTLSSALAADGRAIVGWPAFHDGDTRVVMAAGHAGGTWTRPQPTSAPTRQAERTPSAFLDAEADPVALWTESPGARLRAARLVDDARAPRLDRTPPRLSATAASRVHMTTPDRLTLHLPVVCSEACDVRVELVFRTLPLATTTTQLRGGDRTTLLLQTDKLAGSVLRKVAPLRTRLDIIAADRAGNVTRRSRFLTILPAAAPR